MSNPKTAKQAREAFLDQIRMYVGYWGRIEDISTRDRLNGLSFSILNIIDGTSGLPAMDLVLRPNPDDKAFYQEEGDDWYEDGQVINADVMLHDLFQQNKGG